MNNNNPKLNTLLDFAQFLRQNGIISNLLHLNFDYDLISL